MIAGGGGAGGLVGVGVSVGEDGNIDQDDVIYDDDDAFDTCSDDGGGDVDVRSMAVLFSRHQRRQSSETRPIEEWPRFPSTGRGLNKDWSQPATPGKAVNQLGVPWCSCTRRKVMQRNLCNPAPCTARIPLQAGTTG